MTYFDPDKHQEMEPQPPPRPDDEEEETFVPDIAKKDWAEGDAVFAPWGRAWLFPGTVGKSERARVFVYFESGESGWVDKTMVRSQHAIDIGCRVYCLPFGDATYQFGVITKLNGSSILIQFDDGKNEWSYINMIAIPTGLRPTLGAFIWWWQRWIAIAVITVGLVTLSGFDSRVTFVYAFNVYIKEDRICREHPLTATIEWHCALAPRTRRSSCALPLLRKPT